VFFEFNVPMERETGFPADHWPPGTVVSNPEREESASVYGMVHFELYRRYGCPMDGTHETSGRRIPQGNYWIELFGVSDVPKLVCDVFGLTVVVNAEFKNELSNSGLTGFSLNPLDVPEDFNQSQAKRPVELFVLDYAAADCLRPTKVVPPEPDVCPFCGWGPIVCPACQHVQWDCPRCKNRMLVPESEHTGVSDRRFVISPPPARGLVLEGDKWDGSDVMAGVNQAIVTGRFVQFALRCHAQPFVGKPCLVDVSRCDGQQMARLEEATDWR
jgi:hypothetical protein